MTAAPGTKSPGSRSLLLWRAIRWRAGSSAMFFLVAVAAIVAAAAGPLYLGAADQSLLTSQLAKVAKVRSGLTLSPETAAGYTPVPAILADAEAVPGGAGPLRRDVYQSPIVTVATEADFPSPLSGHLDAMELIGRTGVCRHLHLVAGSCPSARGEVMLSTRSAHDLGVQIGSSIDPPAPKAGGPSLRVVGLYSPTGETDPYWWQQNYFAFGTSVGHLQALDAAFMSLSGAEALAGHLRISDFAQLALRPPALAAPNATSFLASLSTYETTLQTKRGVKVATSLPAVVAVAENEESSAGTIVAVISLQLVLLVLFVLYAVVRSTNNVRAADITVAELRGHSRSSVAWLVLREPIALLLAALPLGLLVAFGLLSVIDGHVLGGASVTTLDPLTVETAVFGCIGGVVAAALGSRALLSGNSFLESSTSARQRRERNAAILDALGLALGVAGIVEMVGTGNRPTSSASPLVYLGPGLVALGAGILASRLIPFLGRLAGRASAWSRSAAATLASRSLSRRAGLARQVLVPSIATGLLVFGVAGLSVVRLNQSRQAGFAVGAPYVLHVAPKQGVDLLRAVRQADPGGKEAMAAAEVRASNGDTLMVDSRRFAAIASWPSRLWRKSAPEIAKMLASSSPPARLLSSGDRIVVTVTTQSRLRPPPVLSADVFGLASQSDLPVSLGSLRPGTHTYSSSLYGLCPGECRLDSLSLDWRPARTGRSSRGPKAASYSFRLDSVGMSSHDRVRRASMDFGAASAWRSPLSLRAVAGGLLVQGSLRADKTAQITPFDLPSDIPTIATQEAVNLDATPGQPRQVFPIGLDGSNLNGRADLVVPAIPRLGSDATMIDLAVAEKALGSNYLSVTFEVWCKRAPSPKLLHALAREKVKVLSIERSSAFLASLEHSGPAFGFDLYGLAALGSALLALGALLFSVAAGTRSRRIEFASLRAVGLPRRVLLRSLLIESTALSLTGALFGTAAAVLSASLALGFLPEFPPGRVGPPLITGLPFTSVALTAGAMFLLLEAAGLVSNFLVVRGVRPELMRLSR